jgi:hypothetical protein
MIKRVRVHLQNAQNMMIQLANRKRNERYFSIGDCLFEAAALQASINNLQIITKTSR